nr:4-Cys prefix domain-containing protein [Nostoc sp. PA-18-2419]
MLYCLNPTCSNPFNLDNNKFCIKCGQTLTVLFRNRFRVIRLLGEGGFSRTYEARDVDNGEHHITVPAHDPIKIAALNAILRDVAARFDS